MSAQFYRPNTPHIIHETIQGEVILVNLQNGSYYSTDDTGAYIWNLLESGVSTEQLTESVLEKYSGDPQAIRAGVSDLLGQLEQEGLVVPAGAPSPTAPVTKPANASAAKPPFVTPTLSRYTEMEDLLLLDPIHDVDDSGWPRRAPETPSS